MRRRPTIIAGVLLFLVGVLLVAGILVTLGKIGFAMYPDPDTNPAHYAAELLKWQPTGLVNEFPQSIPPGATGVHFSAFPGAGQGGPWLQLRLKLSPTEIGIIETKAKAATTHVYGPDHLSFTGKDGDWPTPQYCVGDTPDEFQFPGTFKIFVFNAVDRGMGSWDPHDSYGIAISKSTNEVVYWADK